MTTTTRTKTVTVSGDELTVSYNGGAWVSPCNGQQHGRAEQAMRAELERYFSDCGQDAADEGTADEIESYLSKMTDAA